MAEDARKRSYASDGGGPTATAPCLEQLSGVPGKVVADRMGCLKGGVAANVRETPLCGITSRAT